MALIQGQRPNALPSLAGHDAAADALVEADLVLVVGIEDLILSEGKDVSGAVSDAPVLTRQFSRYSRPRLTILAMFFRSLFYERTILAHLERVEQLPAQVQAEIAMRVGNLIELARPVNDALLSPELGASS